ncbi:MAG: carbohydrate ABC transporter permease [Lachnospiraceae bacterium]|nr:carbohydrate ABC transporter permease [Lachnospiraceae bacterium]
MTNTEKRTTFWERNRKSGGYLLRKRIWAWTFSIARGILLFGLCFMIVQPLLQKVSVSFMTQNDLYDKSITSIPRHFSTQAFSSAWIVLEKWVAFGNSLWLSAAVGLLQVLSCTLVGYGFARYKFPGKKLLFGCVILMLIVPPSTIITPLYMNFRNFFGTGLNLSKTGIPYLIMCATCSGYKAGLYIYMMRQHFRNEPKELEEAAYVDGCGRLRTFFQILLPGAIPMMVSVFLFAFVWQWTDTVYSRVFYPTADWKLVANRLANSGVLYDGTQKQLYGNLYQTPLIFQNQVQAAATLLVLAPLLIIYVVAQKSFVESVSQSGIKG